MRTASVRQSCMMTGIMPSEFFFSSCQETAGCRPGTKEKPSPASDCRPAALPVGLPPSCPAMAFSVKPCSVTEPSAEASAHSRRIASSSRMLSLTSFPAIPPTFSRFRISISFSREISGGTAKTGTGLMRAAVFRMEMSVRKRPLTYPSSRPDASSRTLSLPTRANRRSEPNFRATSLARARLSGLS